MEFVNDMYEYFEEQVEKESAGELQVELYYGGVLGKLDERINYMRRNFIQMCDAVDGNYATIYPDIQALMIPYLFPNVDIADQFFNGLVAKKIASDIKNKTGIRVLGWWEAGGFRHFSSNKPIYNTNDFINKKMRVMSAVHSIPVNELGGSAVSLPVSELYISLKTGLVDGQDISIAAFNVLKLYEVQKYLTLDGHTYNFGLFGINDNFYRALSINEQRIVQSAAKNAIFLNRKLSREIALSGLKRMKSKGVTVIPVSEKVKEQFSSIMRPVTIKWIKSNIETPSLVDTVVNEVSRLSKVD